MIIRTEVWHFTKVTPFGSSWYKCHLAETVGCKREWWTPQETAWSSPPPHQPSCPCKSWFSGEEVGTMYLVGVTHLWWLQSPSNVYCSKETHIQPQESCPNSWAVRSPCPERAKLWTPPLLHAQADKERQDHKATVTRASQQRCSYWWLQSRFKCLEQPTKQPWGSYSW